mmetsp:Transcript_3464/g.5555  ORF Transcript_3464/g.5555 Transcript_3464/m.5555 type:complete len:80 (+) Transcript_3464:229-468(+)
MLPDYKAYDACALAAAQLKLNAAALCPPPFPCLPHAAAHFPLPSGVGVMGIAEVDSGLTAKAEEISATLEGYDVPVFEG